MQVHASNPARSAASRLDVLWSEDGFIKAGSRHKLHEGQAYRASPPGHLQEALARQRRLLHGQELRDYWNLPKVPLLHPDLHLMLETTFMMHISSNTTKNTVDSLAYSQTASSLLPAVQCSRHVLPLFHHCVCRLTACEHLLGPFGDLPAMCC